MKGPHIEKLHIYLNPYEFLDISHHLQSPQFKLTNTKINNMATTIDINSGYATIGSAAPVRNEGAEPRTTKAKLAALGAFLLVGSLALMSGTKHVHTTVNDMKINPFSSINCTEVSALPFCERNPQILICASCADTRQVVSPGIQGIRKQITEMRANPFSSINCTEISALPFCERNPSILICASCAEGEAREPVQVANEDEVPAVATDAAKEAVTATKEAQVAKTGTVLDEMRPLGAICDFVDDHPLCNTFDTTLPCEACECQQLQEEGKCMNPKYMLKCLKCIKKFGPAGQ